MYLAVMMINYRARMIIFHPKTISGLYLKAPMTLKITRRFDSSKFFSSLTDVAYTRAVTKGAADRAIKRRICDKEKRL